MTIATAVCFHHFLNLPPASGMMLGLSFLGFYSYHVKRKEGRAHRYDTVLGARKAGKSHHPLHLFLGKNYDQIGRLLKDHPLPGFMIDQNHRITHWNKAMEDLTQTKALDRIGTRDQWKSFYPEKRPVLCDMVMDGSPDALAGKFYGGKYHINDLMGTARGTYSFGAHLKWTPVIAMGYAAGILCHLLIN